MTRKVAACIITFSVLAYSKPSCIIYSFRQLPSCFLKKDRNRRPPGKHIKVFGL